MGDILPDTSAVRFIGKQGRGGGCWSLIIKVANPLGRNSKMESVPPFILHLHNVFVCLFVENNFTFVILQQQLQPNLIEVSNKKSFFRRGLVQAALCPLHTAVVRSSLGLSLSSFSQHFTTNALVSRFLNVLKIIQGLLLQLSKNICK